MAKLALIFATLLLAFLALSEATTVTTTVTTTTIEGADDVVDNQQQMCRQEVQGRRFRHCQRFMKQGSQEEVMLNMVTNQEQESMQKCCEQLQGIKKQCVCDAVKHMMSQMTTGGGQMEQQMMEKAMNLPRMCKIRESPCRMY